MPISPRRRRVVAALCLAVTAGALTACKVDETNLPASYKLDPKTVLPTTATVQDVSYGPLATQLINIWKPTKTSVGTIIYFHPGGWLTGNQKEANPMILNQISKGWSVVSVNYRLATPKATAWGATGSVRAPQILNDVDRAIRYVKANAETLGLNISTVVTAGASAGGHLAMMAALAPGAWADPTLPEDLKSIDPKVDGVMSMVGPSDLYTLRLSGVWGPPFSEAFLGCAQTTVPVYKGMPSCASLVTAGKVAKDYIASVSPNRIIAATAKAGKTAVPAYLAYGVLDTLITPKTQSDPMIAPWEKAAGAKRVWYDLTPRSGHNLTYEISRAAVELWFAKLLARTL